MPRLYIVPTPIGNLEDVTLRALRVLREVPLILAEDTRHTRKLLNRYEIDTPLLSYHQHNKLVRLERVLQALREGDVALVSSAGMPAVSDPGYELIVAAISVGVDVDVLPGPSAVVTAVVAAALPAPGFLFLGFLPRRAAERRARLSEVKNLPYSLVLYEAPHRLPVTLGDVKEVLGDRPAVAARELSKIHQEVLRGTVDDLLARFGVEGARGEFTLVIGGAEPVETDRTEEALDALRRRFLAGEDRRTAVSAITSEFGIGRNEAYKLWLEIAG